MTFDRKKFRELILYIAERSDDDPRFGATKLNKILYFSDFKAFGLFGHPITGATYVRLDRGPVPTEILSVLREMETAGDIRRERRNYFNYIQKRIRSLRQSEVDEVLSVQERALVDSVLDELRQLNASEVSALSHLELGWQVAADREEIPYETAYISNRRPTLREMTLFHEHVARRISRPR